MNSNEFKPGDILQATHRGRTKGRHPIIYVAKLSATDFIGAMITHLSDETKNTRMKASHFEKGYKLKFDDSYVVRGRFVKPEEWGPFIKIGQLTDSGFEFVKNEIEGCPEETFANYEDQFTD